MAPKEAKALMTKLSRGAMRGKTMYVLPYMMGHPDSPYARACVQITDVSYVAVSMRIMTRMGRHVLDKIGSRETFVKGIHSVGDFDPEKRFIMHFPEEGLVWSIGSGYGGNALLGKKCFALRIASWLGLKQGWLAEHMVIMGIEDIHGNVTYITAAMPSACGKTNLAMLESALPEYKITTIGDDIAWLNIGPDGRLYAINAEAGILRRRARDLHEVQSEHDPDAQGVELLPDALHQRRPQHGHQRALVGGAGRAGPGAPPGLAGQSLEPFHGDQGRPTELPFHGLPLQLPDALQGLRQSRRACPSRPSSWAAGDRTSSRS